jgi:hypothetical protein
MEEARPDLAGLLRHRSASPSPSSSFSSSSSSSSSSCSPSSSPSLFFYASSIFLILAGAFSFLAFVYAAILSKILPPPSSSTPPALANILASIRTDWYVAPLPFRFG